MCREEANSASIEKRECLSLLHKEEADFFFIQQRERLSSLYIEEANVPLFYVLGRHTLLLSSIHKGGRLLRYTEERVSLFYIYI